MWTAVVGMFAAVVGFLGVVVGAAVTGFVTLRQANMAVQREREAEQAIWDRDRKERLDAFQRETLLGVQDAISELMKVVRREYDRRMLDANQSGTWRLWNESELFPDLWGDASTTVMKLEARSFDDELRKLVGMFRGTAVEALLAKDHKRMDSLHAASARWARLVHKRIGVILPTLY